MNPLARRIAGLIEVQGPISVAQFMTLALHDPVHGYYATRDPLGARGDFVTAPEISQIFGELLGLWCAQAWEDQGKPRPARLVELGPGRGTLMADALRAARAVPEFVAAIDVVLVEANAELREAQRSRLRDWRGRISWAPRFDANLADRPTFLLANEFLDALPIRQFFWTESGWCERMVTTDARKCLTFASAPAPTLVLATPDRGEPVRGSVYETSPAAAALVEEVSYQIARRGGAALFIDYGYIAGGFGETLQAVRAHKFARILDSPGRVDLSAHVDFLAMSRCIAAGGARCDGPVPQADLLRALGIYARANRLAIDNPDETDRIGVAVHRLTSPRQMGSLIKALAVTPRESPQPPGF